MPSPLTRTLLAAEGFLELGDPQHAEAELEKLEGADRTCTEVWALRCKIYKATEQWELMKDVAKHLVSLAPDVVDHWLSAAFAARKTGDVQGAKDILLFAKKLHPDDAMIDYNLACYASQLGHLDEARERLKAALDARGDLKHVALQEPDLQPMWESVGI